MKRVLIVGGGVIGLSAAHYALERGFEVTVLDRESAQAEGCSHGNAGMVVPSHFVPLAAPGMVRLGLKWMWNPESPFYIRPRCSADLIRWLLRFWRAANPKHVQRAAPVIRDLSLASRALFQELARTHSNRFGLAEHGLLMLCRTRKGFDEESHGAALARQLGLQAEILDSDALKELEPGVRLECVGGVLYPSDCHLVPDIFLTTLRESVLNRGARLLNDTEVTGWNREENRLLSVNTSRGVYEADQFVLGGGVWSSELARPLGLSLPMQAGKGYTLTLPAPRQLPRICSILTEARVAVTPMGASLRVGGTMELSGNNTRIQPRRIQGIVRSFVRYFPEFTPQDFEGITPWIGLRPCSPDGMPYLGRSRLYENLVVATGHAMMGLSLGPVTGQIVSRILANEAPGLDLRMLDPDRYL